MESILAIGIGLVLRIVVDIATDNDNRVGGVLVGLWEGVVLNHFVRRMPHSFDPYLGFGFRIFVDFLFTQSISRLALVALWALVAMLLSDIAPSVWRDSGLRHLYRQVRKDVRHVQRAVPRIRIENDLPSVRLFNRSRSVSAEVSGSIRSDRAAPSRSTAPSPAPTSLSLGPARRPGRSPPGTFPDVSGWSETATDISVRERTTTPPRPSPALIPSREHAAYEHIDTAHVATSETRTTTIQNTTVTVTQTQTQNESIEVETIAEVATLGAAMASTSLELPDDLSRLDPLTIHDDWVDIDHPPSAQANEPVVPFQPDPDSTPTPTPVPQQEPQPGPSTSILSRPPSRPPSVRPPTIDVQPNTPDIKQEDITSQPADRIPLPESRAASEIGGVYDQPQPRSVLRDRLRSHLDKASTEIGVEHSKTVTQSATKQPKPQRSWSSFLGLSKQSVEVEAEAEVPPPYPEETFVEPAGQSKLDVGSAVQKPEPQIPTPAQVDPPPNILTQPGDTSPLLLAPSDREPKKKQEDTQPGKPDQTPASAGADSSPAPAEDAGGKKDDAGPSRTSPLDIPALTRSPPPPFSEFSGVPGDVAAGETSAENDPLTQDETTVELTEEQKAAEEKRIAFLENQAEELEQSHANLVRRLAKANDPGDRRSKALQSDVEDAEKTLNDVKGRIKRKKFTEAPPNPAIREVSVSNKSAAGIQSEVTSTILNELLERKDAGPMTVQILIPNSNAKKKRELKDTFTAFAKRHQFTLRPDGTAGTLSIMF